jgi:hypothetical protein
MLHRWLELTFSPCGERMESGHSVRERDKAYNGSVGSRRTCSQSTIEYVDLALGSTSSIWAEKCMLGPDTVSFRLEESVISHQIDHPEQASIYLDLGRATSRRMRIKFFPLPIGLPCCLPVLSSCPTQLPSDVDLVIIDYTATAAHRRTMNLDTEERRALERLLRRVLLLPKSPAVLMFHAYGMGFKDGLGYLDSDKSERMPKMFGPLHFGPGTEDLHNLLAMHYGLVQVLSSRAITYDLLQRYGSNGVRVFYPL